MEQMKMNKNMTSTSVEAEPINEDMRIERLQMKLGTLGPPVLVHARENRVVDEIGRTGRRISATKTIQAFIRSHMQTSTRRVFLSHMERRNRHLESLETLARQMESIKKQLEMEKQMMITTFEIFNKYPKPGE